MFYKLKIETEPVNYRLFLTKTSLITRINEYILAFEIGLFESFFMTHVYRVR